MRKRLASCTPGSCMCWLHPGAPRRSRSALPAAGGCGGEGVAVLGAASCFAFLCLAGLWDTHSLRGLSALQVEPQACTYPCQCPSQPLQCPAGTSHVLDACGCCKVCARQLGELCSLQKPCDHHKGLYCDFSKIHRGSGICLGERCLFCCCAVFPWPLQPPQKAPGAQNFPQRLGIQPASRCETCASPASPPIRTQTSSFCSEGRFQRHGWGLGAPLCPWDVTGKPLTL